MSQEGNILYKSSAVDWSDNKITLIGPWPNIRHKIREYFHPLKRGSLTISHCEQQHALIDIVMQMSVCQHLFLTKIN